MIHYPTENCRFATKEDFAIFIKWVDQSPKDYIEMFRHLLELTDKCHAQNSSQPLDVTVDLMMRCYSDMIIESNIMDNEQE